MIVVSSGKYDRFGFIEDLEDSGEEKNMLTSKAALAKKRSEQIQVNTSLT